MAQTVPQRASDLRGPGRFAYSLIHFLNGGKWPAGVRGQPPVDRDGLQADAEGVGQWGDQIHFEPLDAPRSVICHRDVQTMVSELVEDGDWHLLGELLAEWDQSRASCPAKRRLCYTGVDQVADALRDLHDMDNLSILPESALEGLKQAAEAQSLHTLSAVLGRIRIAQIWDAQGRNTTANQSVRAKAFVARAIQSVAHLDATRLKSPLVGGVRFALLPFMPEPRGKLARHYEARVHLDPEDMAPHYNMGRMLLPSWFGSLDQLEIVGRQAVAWTHKRMGAAAYAAIYLGALGSDTAVLQALDPELFEEGVEDLICFRRSDPSHVPHIVEALWDLANLDAPAGFDGSARAKWEARCEQMGDLALDMARGHLTGIHPESWRHGSRGAKTFIARAMRADLEMGADVRVTKSGLIAS